jgi:predicted metal-dependent hydrolase
MPATLALPGQLTIADLDFAVRQSEHRRTVGITVDRDGSLLLHAPSGIQADALAAWAWSKRGWVFRKLAEKHLLLPASPDKEFVSGEGFDYLGRHYRLQLTDDLPGTDVKLERGRLRMPRVTADEGRGRTAVIRWYRHRAVAWLPRRIGSWAERMGLHPGVLDVRDLGYRWGSLGKDNRLNIHWAAIQLPVSLIDYIIVHELAHVGQPSHTPAFWDTVQRALPDSDQRRRRLATTGTSLWLG